MEERSILVGLRVAFIFDFEIICLHKGVAIFSLRITEQNYRYFYKKVDGGGSAKWEKTSTV